MIASTREVGIIDAVCNSVGLESCSKSGASEVFLMLGGAVGFFKGRKLLKRSKRRKLLP